ncbi:hypothetical protein MBLNU13_g00017t1 [Cladosporium sp. NU13]
MTENFGRSHQYVTLVQPEPVKSHLAKGAGTPNSHVDEGDSFSKASTASPITAPQRQVQRKGSEQASPKNVQTTTNSHTAVPPTTTTTSRDEGTRSRPMEKSSEAGSKTQMTPQASATDQQSRLVISKVPETEARVLNKERVNCTQPRALESASNSDQMQSLRPSNNTQSVRPWMTTPGHNSEKPSQVLPVSSDDHFMPSSQSTQGIRKTEVLTAGEQHTLPVKSPLPLISCNRDPAPKPASGKKLSTEPLSESCVAQKVEMEGPTSRKTSSHRGKLPDERTSISDNIDSSGETEKTSLSPNAPSGDVPLQSQTANAILYAQNPPTAEAHLQMSRSSSAQSRTKGTVNFDTQDQSSPTGSSARSGGLSILGSQSRPSFTAINPVKQPEAGSSTLSTSTQTTAITASAPLRERTSKSIPVGNSYAEGNGQIVLERSQPLFRPEVLSISSSSIGLPVQQSRPGLYPPPQQTGQNSPTKVTKSDMAPINQAKQSKCLRSPDKIEQNLLRQPSGGRSGPRSTGQAQQTVTVDLTKISQADEKASRSTHIHASHQNRGTLELGTLAEQARRVAQRRREWGDKVELFETRRRDAELRLDKMLKIMDDSMKHLSGIHKDFEERKPIELELQRIK